MRSNKWLDWMGAASIFSAVTGGVVVSGLAAPGFEVAEQGKDFAVYRKINSFTNQAGRVVFTTNQFTLLENNLHYFEDGQWKPSEDLVESFPDGAVAQRGPTKAIFSPDLNAETVFDLQSSDGQRLRGRLALPSV